MQTTDKYPCSSSLRKNVFLCYKGETALPSDNVTVANGAFCYKYFYYI